MKKRIMVTVMALMLSISMLAGCGGSSKDDYLNDFNEIAEFYQDMADISDDPDEIASLLKDMNVKTSEGKAMKDDFQELVNIMNTMLENQDDADVLMKALGDLSDLYESIEEHAENFVDAAEKAGVSDDDLEDFDFEF